MLGVLAGYHLLSTIVYCDASTPDCGDDETGQVIVMLRPTIHLGYDYVFFSIGPRLGLVTETTWGLSAGMTLGL